MIDMQEQIARRIRTERLSTQGGSALELAFSPGAPAEDADRVTAAIIQSLMATASPVATPDAVEDTTTRDQEIAALRKALRPFAMLALTREGQDTHTPDSQSVTVDMGVCRFAQRTMAAY